MHKNPPCPPLRKGDLQHTDLIFYFFTSNSRYITMENDEKLDLYLTPLITNRESFWRLKNFRYFRKVAVDPLGGLCWPGGEDISPTKIPYYAIKL